MSPSSRLRRALLFMPGDSMRKIAKAIELGVDSIAMDLEDGVALSQKPAARRTIVEALQTLSFGRSERLVRINPVGGEFWEEDLRATVPARPDGYILPKAEFGEQVQAVAEFLAQEERARGWPAGGIVLLPIVETALGVMNVREIALADPRVDALIFGAEDLAGDMGAVRTPAGWEIFYARSAVVLAAKAYRLQAIDMVFFDLNDLEGLEQECRVGRQMAYDGKMAIHPRQVEVIQRVFSPSPEEVQAALRIVRAYEEAQAAGLGAIALDGRMVDMPVVRMAQNTVQKARAAGLLGE
ncbi:MAG: CoA ester lyase [Caldilineales bacterium]|nr:CoA ester lyase [Caldilineales bacterium]MDW8318978.1 CoA ester lyase [Anaerolineae bacterium]